MRQPGSVRRTSTYDQIWLKSAIGPALLRGRARDLFTAPDGTAHVLDEVGLDVDVDYPDRRRVTAIRLNTPSIGIDSAILQQLVGQSASSGFRQAIDDIWPGGDSGQRPLYLLLDDIPVAALVMLHSILWVSPPEMAMNGKAGKIPPVDVCAGWRQGGTIVNTIHDGSLPVVIGPIAPPLLNPDDAIGWHELGELPPYAMRRHRRIDLVVDGDRLLANVFFRDNHFAADEGVTRIIHEYQVDAVFDRNSLTLLDLAVQARALPWQECPEALGSASRLIGLNASELRSHVRREFVGITTCTHLNDTLRSLADVPLLAAQLEKGLNGEA